MLQYAYLYKDQSKLQESYMQMLLNPKNANVRAMSYLNFRLDIVESDCLYLQMVSTDTMGCLHGFMQAELDRETNTVSNLFIFSTNLNPSVFANDLKHFIVKLALRFDYIRFSAVSCHYANAIYSKCSRRNPEAVRYVGYFNNYYRLHNGDYVAADWYEIDCKQICKILPPQI
jgi:hypothetical protein